jgi:hypothetical protein
MAEVIRTRARLARSIPTTPKIRIPAIGTAGGCAINAKMDMIENASQINERRQTARRVDIDDMV